MKKIICLLLLCLLPFILLAHEKTEQETFLTTNEAYKYLKEKIEESDKAENNNTTDNNVTN